MNLCFLPKKSQDQAGKSFINKQNTKMKAGFTRVPFSERVIFVPHCLRNSKKCKAKDEGSYYICLECGACKIGPISKKAKELGYKGLFILKGGKAVNKLFSEHKPKAALAVACLFEGVQGMKEAKKHKIPVQFVPLTKDGCVDTDTDLNDVSKALGQK
jgi:hypothetical protein